MDRLRVGSLFSGAGGLDLGLEWTGHFETVWGCEIDDYPREVFKKRWPDTPLFRDVKDLKGVDTPKCDIICGGFPCQDISIAGAQAGLEGSRSKLFYEMARIIEEAKPKYALFENVPELINYLGEFGEEIRIRGYIPQRPLLIEASQIGAPQKRERIFVLAVRRELEYALRVGRDANKEQEKTAPWRGTEAPPLSTDTRLPDALIKGLQGGELSKPHPSTTNFPQTSHDLLGGGRIESRVGRDFYGIPHRMDEHQGFPSKAGLPRLDFEPSQFTRTRENRAKRIKCLGNAVVPHVGYVVGGVVWDYHTQIMAYVDRGGELRELQNEQEGGRRTRDRNKKREIK